ncbi:MAG: hypothetical protein A2026_00125 [Deltaproteobacteria bacterium RBG_19FT_COMBO_46_12]|nr:MAG: hypothetical protein A2026_00125 [Deltaproteobacteria bacterium RBG_19FT_COMBO_46_12]
MGCTKAVGEWDDRGPLEIEEINSPHLNVLRKVARKYIEFGQGSRKRRHERFFKLNVGDRDVHLRISL